MSDYTRPLLFRETGEKVKQGIKTATSRMIRSDVPPWRVGALSKMYERHPRAGGKPFGEAVIGVVARRFLRNYTHDDVTKEGFHGMPPKIFREMVCKINGVEYHDKLEVWWVRFSVYQFFPEAARTQ